MKSLHQSIYSFCTLFIAIALLLQACNNTPDYKIIRQQVIGIHDNIMMDGERAVTIKMKLDTLNLRTINPADTAKQRQEIKQLIKNLTDADNQMGDWMHAFKVDFKGKTDQETLDYFNAEKLKLERLDSLFKRSIAESGVYLQQHHIK